MNILVFLVLVIQSLGIFATSSAEIEANSNVTSKISCETTKGPLLFEIYRDWAPNGADRFVELVQTGFFTDIALFRCVKDFLTQFGISDKSEYKHWHGKNLKDDPNLHIPIRKNYLSFAGGGPNTRSTQLFIAFKELDFLGTEPWETPFGKVVEGQSTLDSLYKEYGDIPPFGKGPDQQKIHNRGNTYVREEFPETDFILSCAIISSSVTAVEAHITAAIAATNKGQEHERREEEHEEEGEGDVPDGRSALHDAAATGDLKAIQALLHDIKDTDIIHSRDENGWQAIHEAARGGYVDIVKYLIDMGADMGAQTETGGTPLFWARDYLDAEHELIEYLVSIGAPEGEDNDNEDQEDEEEEKDRDGEEEEEDEEEENA